MCRAYLYSEKHHVAEIEYLDLKILRRKDWENPHASALPRPPKCLDMPLLIYNKELYLLWLKWSRPGSVCDKVSSLNLRPPALEGCLVSQRIFSLPGEWVYSWHTIGPEASTGRQTQPEKTFHLVLFAVCVDSYGGNLFSECFFVLKKQTKQTLLVCRNNAVGSAVCLPSLDS